MHHPPSTPATAFTDTSSDATIIINLHLYATAVPNIHQLVNIILDSTSSNYALWRDLMLMTLTRYSLADHVESDDAFPDDPTWARMDTIVLS
jgi:hypothetical protein